MTRSPHLGRTGMSLDGAGALISRGTLQPSPRTLWKEARHAEFTPRLPPRQLASPEFLAGLAIWHFLPVLTARSGSGVKNILRARTLPVPPPTGALRCAPLAQGGAATRAVAAALPVGFARRGGQQMEGALHPFFSIFNPAARSWGGAVEEKGGAFRKATLKPRLWHSGACLIHRTGEQDCVCRLDPTAWVYSVHERGLLRIQGRFSSSWG